MKKYVFCFFVFLASFHLFADDGISITDVNGNEFLTTFQKISHAYFFHHEPQGFNHQIVNGDGSVAIINPAFDYAGKKIPFMGRYESKDGICKHLGFTVSHGVEGYYKSTRFVGAIMRRDGTLDMIHEARSGDTIAKVIVCSRRD